jgi:uncharacterized membrane protein
MELKTNQSTGNIRKSFPKYQFWMLALFFVAAGLNHLAHPAPYISMMPPWLPSPVLLVQISGIAEILGGLGLLFPITRKWACWGLIALVIAVFPANLQVALHGWPGVNISKFVLWARLPFQPLLILWLYKLGRGPVKPNQI